ncbi:hypothetical protein NN561_012952 [Cricetulus griseus]
MPTEPCYFGVTANSRRDTQENVHLVRIRDLSRMAAAVTTRKGWSYPRRSGWRQKMGTQKQHSSTLRFRFCGEEQGCLPLREAHPGFVCTGLHRLRQRCRDTQ